MDEKPSSAKLALKWGVITGVALIVYATLLYTLSKTTNGWYTSVIYLIVGTGLFLAMREYRTLNGGYLSIGEGVGLGALLSTVSGLLSSAYSVLYTTVIDPSVQVQMTEQMRTKMEEQGNLTDEQIEQTLSITQSMQSPGLQFLIGILSSVVIGIILSLIIAAVLRKKKTNPFD